MNYKLLPYPLYFFVSLLFFVSCHSDMDDVEVSQTENKYLVEANFYKAYSNAEINGYISVAGLLFSDQNDQLELLKAEIESGIKVYKIIYNTTFEGNSVKASGLVALPDMAGTYPILSYQNGTNTLNSNAPTNDPNNTGFQLLEMMGSTGFIVSLPDYLGFGESDDMFHPYLHKESTVQAVTDMLRAVEEMVDAEENIEFNKNVYISGYSQGGWATMCLQKAIETKYAAEFNLKASACGAGPYNLTTINQYVTALNEYPMPYFLGYIFNSYINLNPTATIADVLQPPYADRITNLYNGTNSGEAINNQLTTTMHNFFTADYLASWATDAKFKPLTDMLAENSVSAYRTKTPTLILHGTADNLVPPIVSDNIYNDFMALGVSPDLVRKIPLLDKNHSTGIIPSSLTSISWFIQLKESE